MDTKVTLDALIHRHEAGERHPELIRRLNELAWEGFHDPWELVPEPIALAKEEVPMEEEFDPTIIHPISNAFIERHFEGREVRFWKGPADNYLVNFRYDADADREVRLYLSLEGKHHSVLKVRVTNDRRLDRSHFPEAFSFCNEWNASYRWPKAFVDCPDPEQDGDEGEAKEPASGTLTLECQYDLSAGIHQALFDGLVTSTINASWDFWNQAREHGF